MILLLVIPRTAAATISGIPVNAIAQDMIEESPIMKVMVPVIFADSSTILVRRRRTTFRTSLDQYYFKCYKVYK